MHGDRDRILPISQSEMLHDALLQAGAPSILRVIEGAGHGFDIEQVLPQVAAFFEEHLRAPNTPEAGLEARAVL